MESARAAGRAAPVDHYTNETQLSDLLLSVAQCCAKGFRHKKSLRAGINHLDDGILLRGVEIRGLPDQRVQIDRKSTRLNSSHQIISYAVFCLKKKKQMNNTHQNM